MRTLFACNEPIKCHLIVRSADPAIFCRASCTRFSPKSRWPAAAAALTWSRLKVFETARRRTSAGDRPASSADCRIRSRAAARLRAMSVWRVGSRAYFSIGFRASYVVFASPAFLPFG